MPGGRATVQTPPRAGSCEPGWSHVVASQACWGYQPQSRLDPLKTVPRKVCQQLQDFFSFHVYTVSLYWYIDFMPFFFTENEGHGHARVNTAAKGKVLKSSIISNYIIKFLAWFEYFDIVFMLCSMRTGALAKQTCMKWNVEYQSLNHLGLWLCDCISQPCTSIDLLYLFWISADNIWSFFWLIREYLAWTGLSSRDWNLSVFTASYVCLL